MGNNVTEGNGRLVFKVDLEFAMDGVREAYYQATLEASALSGALRSVTLGPEFVAALDNAEAAHLVCNAAQRAYDEHCTKHGCAFEFLGCFTGYIVEFNRRFAVAAEQRGTAFVGCHRKDLDWVFSLQQERTVNRDNTVVVDNRVLPIEKSRSDCSGEGGE